MPALQTLLGKLNGAYGTDEGLKKLAENRDRFGAGEPVGSGLAIDKDTPNYELYQKYLDRLPGTIKVTIKALQTYAVSQTPPTHITFAWAPAYDYEITVWEVPDNKDTRGGITCLIKSPYPQERGR